MEHGLFVYGRRFNSVKQSKRKGGEIQVTEKVTERLCVIIALLALVTAIITDIKESLRT